MEFDVLVEIPKGQRNKYEMDHESGRIRLDHIIPDGFQITRDIGKRRPQFMRDIGHHIAA